MTNSKMTYVMALDVVLNGGEITSEVREKLEALKSSVARKNSSEKKPSANQKANKDLQGAIAQALEVGKAYTVSEMMKVVPELAEASNQKASAMVRQMVADGILVRTEVKRKAYFSLA